MVAEHSATWLHCRLAFALDCGDCDELYFNRKETSCFPLLNAVFAADKSETPNRRQTEWSLSNRFSYRGSSKIWTLKPVPWWVSIQPTWLHCRLVGGHIGFSVSGLCRWHGSRASLELAVEFRFQISYACRLCLWAEAYRFSALHFQNECLAV